MTSPLDRREFLRIGSAALLPGLAGCSAGARSDDRANLQRGTLTGTPSASSTSREESGTASDSASGSEPEPESEPDPESEPGSEPGSAYAQVYREAIDSVVLVDTGRGRGTGFVFDADHVVTNAHVVGRARSVALRFHDGGWGTGTVAGTDLHSDLAAVAVDDLPSGATPLPFVEADPAVGQEVVAIGNPYDLSGSVTTGVVSGVDRSIPAPTGYRIPDAVQTDAAVNPGNSGGPLMSLSGHVLAVINSGGGDDIGFGISAALTRRVVPRLVETGDYDHAHVGVSVTEVTPAIAAANDLDEPRGLLVVDVVPEGPADGTLRTSEVRLVDGRPVPVGGDALLAIDGTPLATAEDLGSYLALQARPGETVEFAVRRDGEERTVEIELGTRPEGASWPTG